MKGKMSNEQGTDYGHTMAKSFVAQIQTPLPKLYNGKHGQGTHHSVLEQIWMKGSYLDQRLPHHESLSPIGLKSVRIDIPHGVSHYIDFSKTDFY